MPATKEFKKLIKEALTTATGFPFSTPIAPKTYGECVVLGKHFDPDKHTDLFFDTIEKLVRFETPYEERSYYIENLRLKLNPDCILFGYIHYSSSGVMTTEGDIFTDFHSLLNCTGDPTSSGESSSHNLSVGYRYQKDTQSLMSYTYSNSLEDLRTLKRLQDLDPEVKLITS